MAPTTEHRRYPRFRVSCPIALIGEGGQKLFTQTIDLSDGGALVAVPAVDAPAMGTALGVELRVPASATAAGEMRNVVCQARVVRHQDVGHATRLGLALEFLKPLNLGLQA